MKLILFAFLLLAGTACSELSKETNDTPDLPATQSSVPISGTVDSIDEKRLENLGGITEVEIKQKSCNNYQHAYSIKRKITDKEDLAFIADYVARRNIRSITPSPNCLAGQLILSVYIYQKREDYFSSKENFISRCIISGSDEPYTVLKKKEERL